MLTIFNRKYTACERLHLKRIKYNPTKVLWNTHLKINYWINTWHKPVKQQLD